MYKSLFLLALLPFCFAATIYQTQVFTNTDCTSAVYQYYTIGAGICAPQPVVSPLSSYVIINTFNSTHVAAYPYTDNTCSITPTPTYYAFGACYIIGSQSISVGTASSFTPFTNVVVTNAYLTADTTCNETSHAYSITTANGVCLNTTATTSKQFISCNATYQTVRQFSASATCSGASSDLVTALSLTCSSDSTNNVNEYTVCNGQSTVTTGTAGTTGTTTGGTTGSTGSSSTSNSTTSTGSTGSSSTTTSSAGIVYPCVALLVLAVAALF